MDSAAAFDSLSYLLPLHDLPSSPGPTSRPVPTGPTQPQPTTAAAAASPPPRGSKKRARASRRAPTTVLTTDASNFRAMVQEFTGIPSPPFPTTTTATSSSSSSSLFLPRPRGFEPNSLPPYLLRPFAHKLPFSSSSSSSTSSSSSSSTATAAATTTTTTTTTTIASPPLVIPPTAHLPLHLQNPIFTFQSLLQSPVLLPSPPTEYGSEVMGLSPWLNGPGWPVNGPVSTGLGGPQQMVGSCKMNYTTAAAEFGVEKVSAESGAAAAAAAAMRGEGMVESWICSSE